MNPLTEFRSLVNRRDVVREGTVVSIRPGTITVRTREGLKPFATSAADSFKAGDTVRFQGNTLLGRSVNVDNIPVFKV